jgi:hypothetical protein
MIDDISIELQAKDVGANRLRAWRIEAGPDLFGVWVATVRFGRIGMAGRALGYQFASEPAARAFVRAKLRRRGTAKQRIGVAYRVIAASPVAAPLMHLAGLSEPQKPTNDRDVGIIDAGALPRIASPPTRKATRWRDGA